MKYTATMEFVGHHDVEFEAENDNEAIQMVENYEIPHPFKDNLYDSSVEECLPIEIWESGGELVWQI